MYCLPGKSLCLLWILVPGLCSGSLFRVGILGSFSESFLRIQCFRVLNKLEKILVSLGVLILHFIIMIAFYEMPEFERITDPYQPELADRSYNLTFCLSDYQEHSFDSCPGRGLAYSLGVLMILVVRPVCKICYRGPTVWVGCTYQIPSVIGQGNVMKLTIASCKLQLSCALNKKKNCMHNSKRHLGWISEYFYKFLFTTNCSNVL